MGKDSKREIRLNYKDNALKLLFKFPKPTIDDVWRHSCRLDHCPNVDGKCNFIFGPNEGRHCSHVMNTKALIDKIDAILNDNYEE